ncbi:MAG: Adenylate cyclase [Hyphomicrobiales bacterium]|nr:Adenylate cyclase [Hyphomicrobiales bacterium]
MGHAVPTTAQVKAALAEILAIDEMRRSPQLAHFLAYVVERKLAGEADAIKAYSIAVDVFGRDATFDPQADPIVRVQARRLRAVLAGYYEPGLDRGPVRILLPVGAYVPRFEVVDSALAVTADESAAAPAVVALRQPRFRRRAKWQWRFVILAAAVALLAAWQLLQQTSPVPQPKPPPATPAISEMPATPVVRVAEFSNLTGSSAFEAAMSAMADHLVRDLAAFDTVTARRIRPSGGDDDPNSLLLSGSVKRVASGLKIDAILSASAGAQILWSTTVIKPWPVSQLPASIREAAEVITNQLVPFSGPLHARGRDWLSRQTILPEHPNLYVCMLQYGLARQQGRVPGMTMAPETALAMACFMRLLAQEPQSAPAAAAWAGLDADVVLNQIKPGTNLHAALAKAAEPGGQASEAAPQRSFVREQLARVLDAQGANTIAAAEFVAALGLNPSNLDARAAYGQALALSGNWKAGMAQSRLAIGAAPNPPPCYFLTLALGNFALGDFQRAVDAALEVAPTDAEFGAAVAVAAGKMLGREDIVDRFLPKVMTTPEFHQVGILPRLGLRLRDPAVLRQLGEALAAAGVPRNALNGPFETTRTTARPVQ